MVDNFSTSRDCNNYNFISFFFLHEVFFNSWGNEFHSCTNINIPKDVDTCNLASYQLVLNFCLIVVFRFKSKNGFILKTYKVRNLKKKHLSCGKWNFFCWTCLFFIRVFNRGCEWKIIGEMLEFSLKKQITKPFFRNILAFLQ